MPIDIVFDFAAVHIIGEKAADLDLRILDAKTLPYRYVLTRVIGVIPDIDIDHAGVSCEPGDRLMLCSDGLFKALSLDELKVVLTTEVEPQRSPDRLATSAVEHEAEGNVTAMIIDVRAD